MGGRGWAGWSGVRGGKWDNCNSIINKYILKKKVRKITMMTNTVNYLLAILIKTAEDLYGFFLKILL